MDQESVVSQEVKVDHKMIDFGEDNCVTKLNLNNLNIVLMTNNKYILRYSTLFRKYYLSSTNYRYYGEGEYFKIILPFSDRRVEEWFFATEKGKFFDTFEEAKEYRDKIVESYNYKKERIAFNNPKVKKVIHEV